MAYGKRIGRLELAAEYPAPNEGFYTEKLGTLLREHISASYPPGKMLRDAHPKQHGCVKAQFIVESTLPEEFRVGVFRESRSYDAVIRFSNASPTAQPDIKKDNRGMAIKLIGVEGEKLLEDEKDAKTQDFITISFDSFFSKTPEDLYKFSIAFFAGPLHVLWYVFNPFDSHIGTLTSIKRSARVHTSPLDIRYWSMTPYLFGARAVKYSVRPWAHVPAQIPHPPTDCYLRENLQRQLAYDPANFDFMVQFQVDPYKMPIEDPTVSWDEAVSPFHKVATIVIPPQQFDNAKVMEFGDNLSFSPWHSLPEHRPLGGINRSRKLVYEEISKFRHERNDMPRREPSSIEEFPSVEQAKSRGV